MKKPFLAFSPSSYKLYCDNRVQFVKEKIIGGERFAQNNHMAAGSSFDAYVKCYLHKLFHGEALDFDKVFESQVESQHRVEGLKVGKEIFDSYMNSGALARLVEMMTGGVRKPQFEASATENVLFSGKIGALPLSGKPDLLFHTKDNRHVILDWKVNGYYTRKASPKQGYVSIFPGGSPHDNSNMELLDNYIPVSRSNQTLIAMQGEGWAQQLTVYAWLFGLPVGEEFVAMVHQLVYRDSGLRVAVHSFMPSKEFQHQLYEEMHTAFYRIQAGLYFDDRTAEQSERMLEQLASGDTLEVDPLMTDLFGG